MSKDIHADPVGINNNDIKDIYIIKNDINNLVYIGQSSDPQKRFHNHYLEGSRGQTAIGRAMYKYGEEHFRYEILEHGIKNYKERERYWIEYYDSLVPNGYNITKGGEKHPVKYGDNSPQCTLLDSELVKLKDDLKNTKIPLGKLAQKYNISKKQVLRINQGISRCSKNEDYPLRKNPNLNGKLTEKDVDIIIDMLKYTYLYNGQIGKRFGVNEHSINNINNGTTHHRKNVKYPIRKWKSCGVPPKITYEDVTEIMRLLRDTKISMRKIAKEYDINYSLITAINNGTSKRFRREHIKYPLRNRY